VKKGGKVVKLKKGYLDWEVRDDKTRTGKALLEGYIEAIEDGKVQKTMSRKSGEAIYVVRKEGKIVHIHCKDNTCGNEWKINEGIDWKKKFDVQEEKTIKCKKCGRVYDAN
jgi:hypothetical protein